MCRRQTTPVRNFSRAILLGIAVILCEGGWRGVSTEQGDLGITLSPKAAPLSQEEVKAILERAAASLDAPLVVAVVDRVGNALGVLRKPGAPDTVAGNFSEENTYFTGSDADAEEVAVALARTGAFFSNNQAPLSSRTVRFISGIHFPPGIRFTSNAALYGIENTNRGCDMNVSFHSGRGVPQSRSFLRGGLPCESGDTRGCGLGILTGKPDLLDSDFQAVHPGGIPIFRGQVLVGGIGVVGNLPGDHAEFAAFAGAGAAGLSPAPALPLSLRDIVVFLDGVRLPFVQGRTLFEGKLPDGASAGTAAGSEFLLEPLKGACYDPGADGEGNEICRAAPEGFLVGPSGGSRLSVDEVRRIVDQARKTAEKTRAAIRLPLGSRTRMAIAVGDVDGTILALFRMPDSTIFSIDVAVAKARNVVYFSGDEPGVTMDLPGVRSGTAITNRPIGFGSQPLYPPGIDGTSPGPFFDLFVDDTQSSCSQGSQATHANQNGVVFFPGSLPLYKNGEIVGGLGISGDGVEQDDFVAWGGGKGFEPPRALRSDRIKIRRVRLPFLKFPRNPTR
jgi:uncharacterized protein GlcG (DUF336 family)